MTITTLLVEDAPDVRTMLRIALKTRGGFDVVGEAGTGAEATRLAGRLRPDVVVLDLGLPDLTGKDLLAQIRRQSPTSRIVIFSGTETDRAWFEQRTSGYVVKDTDLEDLIDVLADAGADQSHDEAVVELTRDIVAAREARAMVSDLLGRWGYHELVDDAALVVSELVTNAVTHASSNCAVVVNRSGDGVRIQVRDQGAGSPDPQPPSDTAEGGRGLMIVSALAKAWGVDSVPPTKSVWVELSAR
jgi:CheY-like chemotaxis protein/anti-sigma regulatory factor (Ser/Thr protein kinase)